MRVLRIGTFPVRDMGIENQLLKVEPANIADQQGRENNLLILLVHGDEDELESAFEPGPPQPRASKRLITRLLKR